MCFIKLSRKHPEFSSSCHFQNYFPFFFAIFLQNPFHFSCNNVYLCSRKKTELKNSKQDG